MTVIQAFILGIVQGITEFLPISSDGHLVLTQHLIGIQEPPVAFDIFLHAATLVAIICFFWSSFFRLSRRQITAIGVATIPTGIIGLAISKYIDALYASLVVTAVGFFITSLFLLASRKRHAPAELSYKKALLLGVVQGIAVLPGVSRSGTTIATALIMGIPGPQAFSFSFLAAIPAITGAQLVGISKLTSAHELPLSVYIVGCIAAGITGLFSLKLLKNIVNHHQFHRFGFYTSIVALLAILLA